MADTASSRMAQAYQHFMLSRVGVQFQETDEEQALYRHSMRALLRDREPEVILPLELDGEVWTLLVVDDGVELHRVTSDSAEMRFLGRLQGDYVETLRLVDNAGAFQWTLRFTDERLPGKVLELSFSQSLRPAAWEGPETRTRREEIEKLGGKLREWASSPE